MGHTNARSSLRGIIAALASGVACAIAVSAQASSVENPMFGYTHLLPSPFTLSAGRLVLGTDIAFGLTDFLQVGTNVFADFYKIYNANAKISLIDLEPFALALTGGWQSYNRGDFDLSAPDSQVTSWMPGLVAGVAVAPTVAWLVGGNLNFTSQTITTSGGAPVSGYFRGASVESDVSWAYYQSKKSSTPLVLAGGASYDITYGLVGFGLSHYFKNLKVGVHYYPNSTRDKFLPILAGSAAVDF